MSQYVSASRKVLQLPRKLLRRIRSQGAVNAAAWCWYQLAWRWREWRMGIDTREFSHGVVVEDSGAAHGYEPIDHRCFDIILDYLGDPSEDGFLDYGCGMGRAVLLAARRPFLRVIGLEIDERLVGIARRQVERARGRKQLRCPDVEIIAADAATWPIPAEVTCVFLFNSFTGELLERVLEQVRRSVVEHPRPLKLIYVQPIADRDTLADLPWLKMTTRLPTGFWTHVRTVVYEPHLPERADGENGQAGRHAQRIGPTGLVPVD